MYHFFLTVLTTRKLKVILTKAVELVIIKRFSADSLKQIAA